MADQLQLTLQLSADLPRKHSSLRKALNVSITQYGQDRAAGILDYSSSRLGENLTGARGRNGKVTRKFDVDELELYMERSGDLMPLHYLIAKFIPTPEAHQAANAARVASLARQLVEAMGEAEVIPAPARRARR